MASPDRSVRACAPDPTPSPHPPSRRLAPDLLGALEGLRGVSLAELDRAQLHDRIETKLVMRTDTVHAVLAKLSDDYLVMDHEDKRVQRYSNTYFDTPTLTNYTEHHNQKRRRCKVRYRSYVDSDLTFFEVKRNVDGRTVKERQPSRPVDSALAAADAGFLADRVDGRPDDLGVSIVVDYDRVLLVNTAFDERVTIDMNLTFRASGSDVVIPNLAVVEFKQDRLDRTSPAMRSIDRPTQLFSKYCVGLASCRPELKRNRFKRVFLGLERLGASPQMRSARVAA